METILIILSRLITALIPLTSLFGPFIILAGIILFSVSFVIEDTLKKKKYRKISLWLFFTPIVLLFALVTLWGIVGGFAAAALL